MHAGGMVGEQGLCLLDQCKCNWHAVGEQEQQVQQQREQAHEQTRLLMLEQQLMNVDAVAEVRAHSIVFWMVTKLSFSTL